MPPPIKIVCWVLAIAKSRRNGGDSLMLVVCKRNEDVHHSHLRLRYRRYRAEAADEQY